MKDLCFFDVETTGLDSEVNEILEIALIRTNDQFEEIASYHTRILPRHIETAHPKALEVNHYNEDLWKETAIPMEEALKHIMPLMSGAIPAGHNVGFDIGFLEAAVKLCNLHPNWSYHKFDTVSLGLLFARERRARKLSLGNLLQSFNLKPEGKLHTALEDIRMTLALARAMIASFTITGPEKIRGTLIAIEGVDGSGKSSVIQGLVKKLKRNGISVAVTEEPTRASDEGRKIRESKERPSPEVELGLFMKDRELHVPLIESLRDEYEVVILDRYYISSMAYQGVRVAESETSLVESMMQIKGLNEKFAPKPDLVLVLDSDPEEAFSRVLQRGTQDGFEGLENLKQVREAFLAIAKEELLECPLQVIAPGSLRDVLYDASRAVMDAYYKEV